MADKLTSTPNDNTMNYQFYKLQLVVETFGHTTKWTSQVPKVVKPNNKKTLLKDFL